jgi:putative addiction module component (TIGR02574 family)
MAVSDVLDEALRLPANERARLALELIRSLDVEADDDAASMWDEEIARRSAEVGVGSAETMTLDEYRAHVRTRRATRRSSR